MKRAGRSGFWPRSAATSRRRCGRARNRSTAKPYCCTPSRGLATPSSSCAMRRLSPSAAADRVILEVQRELVPLLPGWPASTAVIARGEPLPAFDLHCPLLSLPLAFATELATIPARRPYLAPPACERSPLGEIVCRSAGRSSAWRGPATGSTTTISIGRSALRRWRRCSMCRTSASSACSTTSASAICRSWQNCRTCIRIESQFRDFADTAAAISLIDAVISVDTAVAHLAGAMGKPLCCCCRSPRIFAGCASGRTVPWYPTARLYRQPKFGDWDSVISTLRQELLRSRQFFRRRASFRRSRNGCGLRRGAAGGRGVSGSTLHDTIPGRAGIQNST